MNRFLRVAVIAGVENSVRLHIERGDDLGARDNDGYTPLMLAAAKNKPRICSLLLDAGVDDSATSPSGMDALAIAIAAGAKEAAEAISQARAQKASSRIDSKSVALPSPSQPQGQSSRIDLDDTPIADFELDAWEAEVDSRPPDNDIEVVEAATKIQSEITKHAPIDDSVDWSNFEVFLPEIAASLARSEDAEAQARLRLLLLRALREGSVPAYDLEDLSTTPEQEIDQDAVGRLTRVVNDLGAEIDERFEYESVDESFVVHINPKETEAEEREVDEAMAHLESLESNHNDPIRIFLRQSVRGALLSADDEVELGKGMELHFESALALLAEWAAGMVLVRTAALKVKTGEIKLSDISSGPADEPADIDERERPIEELAALSPVLEDEKDETETERDDARPKSGFEELSNALDSVCAYESASNTNRERIKASLTELRLSRDFLLKIAETVSSDDTPEAIAFLRAMRHFRARRDRMFQANLRLVVSIAKRFVYSGIPLDELIQEGNIGLLKAVERYDWRRGFRFSTFATWWIRQAVSRYVSVTAKTIRLPTHAYELLQHALRAAHSLEHELGRPPTAAEIAGRLTLPQAKIAALMKHALEPLSIDLIDVDKEMSIAAQEEFWTEDPQDVVERAQFHARIEWLLGKIGRKKAQIIRMRYGIGVSEAMTLDEVGRRLEVTRERIRQIEKDAIGELRLSAQIERLIPHVAPPPPLPAELTALITARVDAPQKLKRAPTSRPVSATLSPDAVPTTTQENELEEALQRARELGYCVEDDRAGSTGIALVKIEETPDMESRMLVLKLMTLGFKYWTGRGYWK